MRGKKIALWKKGNYCSTLKKKLAFFLFLGQAKMWDPRAALAAGTRDVYNVMSDVCRKLSVYRP